MSSPIKSAPTYSGTHGDKEYHVGLVDMGSTPEVTKELQRRAKRRKRHAKSV